MSMNLAQRDSLVVTMLAQVAPLTGPQAVNEVVRILGRENVAVVSGDVGLGLIADVSGLQQAVVDLNSPANRAAASVQLATLHGPPSSGTRIVVTPKPLTMPDTQHYRMRVVASGN
jgi:hypothetical protein